MMNNDGVERVIVYRSQWEMQQDQAIQDSMVAFYEHPEIFFWLLVSVSVVIGILLLMNRRGSKTRYSRRAHLNF